MCLQCISVCLQCIFCVFHCVFSGFLVRIQCIFNGFSVHWYSSEPQLNLTWTNLSQLEPPVAGLIISPPRTSKATDHDTNVQLQCGDRRPWQAQRNSRSSLWHVASALKPARLGIPRGWNPSARTLGGVLPPPHICTLSGMWALHNDTLYNPCGRICRRWSGIN